MPVVVITGSSRGIGLGMAVELAARGAKVVITGRNQDTVDAGIAAVVERTGDSSSAIGVTCDVTRRADHQRVWDEAVAAYGRVDHWVNNAGSTASPVPFWEVDPAQVRRVVDTNITGLLHGCSVAASGMATQDGGGWIWNVEGMGSKGETRQGMLPYATTKAAVGTLLDGLRKDAKAQGVALRVGAIRPGINITQHFLTDVEALDPDDWEKQKKVLNVLGDLPETTTPFLAEKLLAATKDGTRIQWLSPAKISWRFATSWAKRRDLFAEVEATATQQA